MRRLGAFRLDRLLRLSLHAKPAAAPADGGPTPPATAQPTGLLLVVTRGA